jgi:hypothetical protein
MIVYANGSALRRGELSDAKKNKSVGEVKNRHTRSTNTSRALGNFAPREPVFPIYCGRSLTKLLAYSTTKQ